MAQLESVISAMNQAKAGRAEPDPSQAIVMQLLQGMLDKQNETVSNSELRDILGMLAKGIANSNKELSEAIAGANVKEMVDGLTKSVKALESTLSESEKRLSGDGKSRTESMIAELKTASQSLEKAISSIRMPELDLTPVLDAISAIEIPETSLEPVLEALKRPETWEFEIKRRLSDDKIESVTATRF